MRRLQLLAVIGLATTSNYSSAFVSISPTTIHASSYPSTSVSLKHLHCNKRRGYPRSDRRSIDRSTSSTTLSAIPSPQAVTTSISGFYKAYPILAGIIVGLVSRLTQYSSRKDTKLSSLNNKNSNNYSNFTIRALCSGLVLGALFETTIHSGIIISILFGTANIANGSINGMSIARFIS